MNSKIPALLALFIFMACNKQVTTKNVGIIKDSTNEWQNPIQICNIPEIATDISNINSDNEGSGKDGLINFCDRMNEKFSKSGLSTEEALGIYGIIEKSGLTLDESFGQPDPDQPSTSNQNLSERISIVKLNGSTFEIFYIKTGCGKTYYHGKFLIPPDSTSILIEPVEVWKAYFPC